MRFLGRTSFLIAGMALVGIGLIAAPPPQVKSAPRAKKTADSQIQSLVAELVDKAAIKELLDAYSVFADQKAVEKQSELFIEDGVVESYRMNADKSELVSKLVGRKQMIEVFGGFLKNFDTVYHSNGQCLLNVQGDHAKGTSYCSVILVGAEGGKRMKTVLNAHYQDEFVRKDGKWFFEKRVSIFDWQERSEVGK